MLLTTVIKYDSSSSYLLVNISELGSSKTAGSFLFPV